MAGFPEIYSVWKDTDDFHVMVMNVTNQYLEDDRYPTCIVYEGLEDDQAFTLTLAQWWDEMTEVDLDEEDNYPDVGSVWSNRRGIRYRVVSLANEESIYLDIHPISVVYETISNGNVWVNSLEYWNHSMVEEEEGCGEA